MAMSQALQLITDLKLGWYTSIPPREMFAAQIIGTVLGALTNCRSNSETVLLLTHVRRDTSISSVIETPDVGWLATRSHGAVDRTSTRDLLLGQYHLGCRVAAALLCGQILGPVLGLPIRRSPARPIVVGAQALARQEAQQGK